MGSLLRPPVVHDARLKYHADRVGPDGYTSHPELQGIEDEAIESAVRMQQDLGLMAVTDGEFRRRFWHYDFMGALTGLTLVERDKGIQFHGVRIPPIFPTVTGRLDFPSDHPMLDHFRYVASITDVQPKISIPGPSACHFRVAPEDIAPAEYADIEVFFERPYPNLRKGG